MSNLTGYSVKDSNYVLRFGVIILMGILSFSSVLFWRSQLLFAAEYQDLPVTHQQIKILKENQLKRETEDNKLIREQIEQ